MSRAFLPAVLGLLAACGGDATRPTDSSGVQPPPGGKAEFTVLPVNTTGTLEPLGHLAPPGHTMPTDHVYFYAVDYDKTNTLSDTTHYPVYAPATGTVSFIIQPVGTDDKIELVVTTTFRYYLDHVFLRPDIKVGTVIHAGEMIGTQNPGAALDMGAYDLSTPPLPGFVNPKRYADQTLHCVNPFSYFVEPLRSQLYARQRRLASAPPDAPIDFDRPGRLAGNWYEQSVPNDANDSEGPNGWPKSLAFVYDNRDPSLPRVSIGGTIATQEIWTIDPDAPRFESVTPTSGSVRYRLRYTLSTNVQYGVMLVQMLADDRIKVEVFEGGSDTLAASAAFDNKAFIYVR